MSPSHDRGMPKARTHGDSSSETNSSEPRKPSHSNTPGSIPEALALEAMEQHEGSIWGQDFISQESPTAPAILVMGVTGAGKSNFIRIATGDSSVTVGHSLRSGTKELQFHRKELGGKEYVFVDIPGFNDTERSESDIVCEISTGLSQVQNIKGILYFHRILDERMLGSSIRHLRIFQALCGKSCMGKVTIVTTHWDRVSQGVGEERESELKEHYWKELITDGATVAQFRGSLEDADAITKRLTQDPQLVRLAIQEQIIGCTFEETDAGRIVNEQMQSLRRRKKEELRIAREELALQEAATYLGEPQTSRETTLMAIIRSQDQIIQFQDENYKALQERYRERGSRLQFQEARLMKKVITPRGNVSKLGWWLPHWSNFASPSISGYKPSVRFGLTNEQVMVQSVDG